MEIGAQASFSFTEWEDDDELVRLAKNGNAQATKRLIVKYQHFVKMKAHSYFLAGGDTDDLVQRGSSASSRPSATTGTIAPPASAVSPNSASPGRSSPPSRPRRGRSTRPSTPTSASATLHRGRTTRTARWPN